RLIAAYINRETKDADSCCYGITKKIADWKYSKQVADELGFKHYFIEIMKNNFTDYSDKTVSYMDCMTVHLAYDYYIVNYLNEIFSEPHTIYNGYLGDSVFGSDVLFEIPDFSESSRHTQLSEFLISTDSAKHPNMLLNLIKKDFCPDYYETLTENIKKIILPKLGLKNEEIVFNFKMRQRQPRYTLHFTGTTYGSYFDYTLPFTDYDLVDFCMSLPLQYLRRQKLQQLILKKKFPRLASVKWQQYRLPLNMPEIFLKISKQIQKAHLGLVRITEKISKGRFTFPSYHFEIPIEHWLRLDPQKQYIEKLLLDKNSLNRIYLNSEGLKKILDEHMSGKRNYCRTIYTLVTLELWCRHNLD
nr:hypothetical protein [Candidatus Dependentiae bacterium]